MSTTTQTNLTEKAENAIRILKQAVNKSITGVSFVSIKNYTNQQGETSNYLFNLGINYDKAKQDDIKLLQDLDVTTLKEAKSSIIDLEKAKVELINAFIKPNENRSNGQQDAYTSIGNGIKVHNESGLLYVWGFQQNKTVLVKGTYKEVKSSDLTIAKNELRKLLKTGKFKQFSVAVGNTIKANGTTLEI